MNINVQEHNIQIVIINLEDRIDAFTAPALRKELRTILDEGKVNIVADLTKVTFLDSAAIAALVNALKQARAQGGDIKLVWPQTPSARRIFHLTKFDRVFDMADSAEIASQSFGAAR